MPTIQVFTKVKDLPANANGDVTILKVHHDESLDRMMEQIEGLSTSVFSAGGVLAPGTVAIETSTVVHVQNRTGLVSGATAFVSCGDQSVDMAALADGIKYRAVITAAIQVTNAYTFTDPDTGESITHSLVAYLGKLEILTGDASNYPALPPNALDVATLSKAAGAVTIDANQDAPPTPRAGTFWLEASATLDFPSIAAGSEAELTVAVAGAAVGSPVVLGPPSTIEAGLSWGGYVSAADTVTIRVRNDTAAAIDPASASWSVRVFR